MSDRPQFTLRLLFVMTATCGVAFALIARRPHLYLEVTAISVPVFWFGLGFAVLGGSLETQGDAWFLPSVLIGLTGTLTSLFAVFTAGFYSFMLVVEGLVSLIR